MDPTLMADGGPHTYWDLLWSHLLSAMPGMGVVLVCLIVCAALSFRHPRAGVCASIAFALMLLSSLASSSAHAWITWREWTGELWYEESRPWRTGIAAGWWVLHAMSLGLLTYAVFARRSAGAGAGQANSEAALPAASPAPAIGPGEGPGPGPSQPIPKAFFLASIYGSVLIAFLLMIPGIVMLVQQNDDLLPLALGVVCFAYLPLIYSIVMGMVLVYKLWATIQDGDVRTTPGKAVGFLWIPLFNLYWIFQAYWGFAQDLNAYTSQRGINARRVSEGLALTVCIIALAGIIPYVGILIGLVNIVLMWIFLSQAIDGANAVRAARAQVSAPV